MASQLKGLTAKIILLAYTNSLTSKSKKLKLVEGQEIAVEGSIVEDYSDFYTFDVYKKKLT
ncbi:hypothetical protein OL548_29180 [Lysinibacillus sp. MHQ-1]|nr:hypothetical protein OL548_29180 [Lysinibacillus sp. MHQ-1]